MKGLTRGILIWTKCQDESSALSLHGYEMLFEVVTNGNLSINWMKEILGSSNKEQI